jgi:hypothetical protein
LPAVVPHRPRVHEADTGAGVRILPEDFSPRHLDVIQDWEDEALGAQ